MPYSPYLPEHMGSSTLTPPGPFVAGRYAELTLIYTAGKFGIDDTGMMKISWRTTSDMASRSSLTRGGELHHGRGEQRRQARILDRPAQHPALGEHVADPRRPRLSARGRHHHGAVRRSSRGLAGLPAADQRARSASSSRSSSMRSRLTSSPSCRSAGLRSGGRDRRRASRRSAVARGRRRAVPARHRRRGHLGQSDR